MILVFSASQSTSTSLFHSTPWLIKQDDCR